MATETFCASFTRTDFPFTQNGYRYEKLGGPFTASDDAGCLDCGACGGEKAWPKMTITISWSDEAVACRTFFDTVYRNGDTYNICPDYYAAYRHYDSHTSTDWEMWSYTAAHFWHAYIRHNEHFTVAIQGTVNGVCTHGGHVTSSGTGSLQQWIAFSGNRDEVADGYVVTSSGSIRNPVTIGNGSDIDRSELGICLALAATNVAGCYIRGCIAANSYTMVDPDNTAETITISWSKGPGNWSRDKDTF